MRELPKSADKRLLIGTEGFSDAGVFEVAPSLLLVQSLDFFAPLVDDPYTFGQISAANSLSDVFAMGGMPVTALNIVCFPDHKLGLNVLSEILKGGAEKIHEAGASIVGGHSIRDDEIKYGLSVTGVVSRELLMTNGGAQPGDLLVLTKKLGTGFITTAMKQNRCSDESAKEAIREMLRLNKVASEAARQHHANASTDITGYGLAVHACEMAQASGVTLQIELDQLAILPGALDLAKRGFITRANKTNRMFSRNLLKLTSSADKSLLEVVFDPQTSGGLLLSIAEKSATALVDTINCQESGNARVVGRVLKRQDHALHL